MPMLISTAIDISCYLARFFRHCNSSCFIWFDVVFENFLHTTYIGQKRFSLEGGENTITFLNEIVNSACKDDVKEVVIGMPHRGRLNVLTSILKKTYDEVFNEFEGNMDPDQIFGDGDVSNCP